MFNNLVTWFLLSFFFLIFEMGSPGLLFFLAFSVGAAATAFASFIISDLSIQIAFFMSISIVAILTLKYSLPTMNRSVLTNGDALKGRTVLVHDLITPEKAGAVKIDGVLWTAFSGDAGIYKSGALVTIAMVRGAHVVVKISHTHSLR